MKNRISLNPVKKSSQAILLLLTIFLMLFPLINTVNQLLVNLIEPLILLKPIQQAIIPYEGRLVRVLLGWLSIPVAAGDTSSSIITLQGKTGGLDPIAISWNCLGWQSMVLIGASLIAGLQGQFTFVSKIEALIIGLLVTFWLNIFRLTAIFYLYYHINRSTALIFHDYGAVIITILWLLVFWWFSFNFVLQKKEITNQTSYN